MEQAKEEGQRLEFDREHTRWEVELKRPRAVAKQTRKWEEREARLVQLKSELEEQLSPSSRCSGAAVSGLPGVCG